MKVRTSAVVSFVLVEAFLELIRVFPAPRVRPTEDLRRRLTFRIDTNEAVPKRAGSDVGYFGVGSFKQSIDRRRDLSDGFVSIYLGSAVSGDGQRTFDLAKRTRNRFRQSVIKSGADAGRTDI